MMHQGMPLVQERCSRFGSPLSLLWQTDRMTVTARERARAEITAEIVDAARQQLAEVGAQQLSLRAVARQVGMVSSAVYRYFPSRDELLTRLIVEAYEGLAHRVETAEEGIPRTRYRARWRAACTAVRGWALEHPHEYALVYGSPVPGYAAPQTTVEPAARVAAALIAAIREAAAVGELDAPGVSASGRRGLGTDLQGQLRALAEQMAPELPLDVLVRVVMAWTQLFGMVSFELFGHFVGTMDPTEPFFDHTVEHLADLVGLPPTSAARSSTSG